MRYQKVSLSSLAPKWQLFHEESRYYAPEDEKVDFEELRGVGDSRIYMWGEEGGRLLICVSTDNPRLQNRLVKHIPGLLPYSGSVKRLGPDLLEAVATFIKAKKRRVYSEAGKAALRERGRRLAQSRRIVTPMESGPKTDNSPE